MADRIQVFINEKRAFTTGTQPIGVELPTDDPVLPPDEPPPVVIPPSGDLAAMIATNAAAGRMVRTDLATYDVVSSIIIDAKGSWGQAHGFDGQGITLRSRITNGGPVILYRNTGGVNSNDRYLQLRNFTILGNSMDGVKRDGNGVEVYRDSNQSFIYNFVLENVNALGVGGHGIALRGSVFEGQLLNCWGDSCGGFGIWGETWPDPVAGGWANMTSLHIVGGGTRKNKLGGVGFNNLTFDVYISHHDIIQNQGPAVVAPNGLAGLHHCTLEANNMNGVERAAIVFGRTISASFNAWKGPRNPDLIRGYGISETCFLTGNKPLYYDSGVMRLGTGAAYAGYTPMIHVLGDGELIVSGGARDSRALAGIMAGAQAAPDVGPPLLELPHSGYRTLSEAEIAAIEKRP